VHTRNQALSRPDPKFPASPAPLSTPRQTLQGPPPCKVVYLLHNAHAGMHATAPPGFNPIAPPHPILPLTISSSVLTGPDCQLKPCLQPDPSPPSHPAPLTISSSVLTGPDCQLKPTMLVAAISISARMPGTLLLPGNQEK
jgi:hypothetical protein